MKKKKPKPKREWTSRPPMLRRGERLPPPPDYRWRQWRRCAIVLLLAVLLPFLAVLGEDLRSQRAEQEQAVAASVQAATAPIVASASATDRDAEVLAGRTLGFLHTVAFMLNCILMILIFAVIMGRWFDEDIGMAAFFVSIIGTSLLAIEISMMIFYYAVVPLIDFAWEACGGLMVPYELVSSRGTGRGGGNISSHKWGENAALLSFFGLLAIAWIVAKLREPLPAR